MLAFERGDRAGMAEQVTWSDARPDDRVFLRTRAWAAAAEGQMQRSRELFNRIVDDARRRGLKRAIAVTQCELGSFEAEYGNSQRTVSLTTEALANAPVLLSAASVMASAGRPRVAQSLVAQWLPSAPPSAPGRFALLPFVNARVQIALGRLGAALEALRPAPMELSDSQGAFGPYQRAITYLAAKHFDEAIREFTRILDHHHGVGALTPYYSLAPLQLARACSQVGDIDQARKQYEVFLTRWKDADADVPVLVQAKREYSRLTTARVMP